MTFMSHLSAVISVDNIKEEPFLRSIRVDQGFRMETSRENYFENYDWEGKVEYNTTDIF